MSDEEVTNLIAELRKHAEMRRTVGHRMTADLQDRAADALARSAKTREAQADAWDEGVSDGQWNAEHEYMIQGGICERIENPYRPVAVVPEDPKPGWTGKDKYLARGYEAVRILREIEEES